ncbi:hypothetical protein [Lacipirellula parvula]|uniref:hypothetical protein n=1 Tax=Lacipirellula parvula TaxID=2650471 RepID=UPI001260B35A|nr:hypothetical protein [Lacipirellula parvula]
MPKLKRGEKMSDQCIREELAKASAIVGAWPEWKQNVLVNSTKSTNSSSRMPVIGNDSREKAEAASKPAISD